MAGRNGSIKLMGACALAVVVVFGVFSLSTVCAAQATWAPAIEIKAPANASAARPQTVLEHVACPAQGFCVAVGSYEGPPNEVTFDDNQQVFGVIEQHGVWGQANEIQLPADAGPEFYADPVLAGLSCTASESCATFGVYGGSHTHLMGATKTGGVWSRASEITLPSNAALEEPIDVPYSGIACPLSGTCVAVGGYRDTTGQEQPMVINEAEGIWGRASQIALPANATSGSIGRLELINCPVSGGCVAVGSYRSATGSVAMVAAEANGVWGQARELPVPIDAASDPRVQLETLACPASESCVAVGSYIDSFESRQALILSEASGIWSQDSFDLSVPWSAAGDIACSAPRECVVLGAIGYTLTTAIGSSTDRGIRASEVGGVWGQPSEIPAPSNSTYAIYGGLGSLACPGPGNCVAIGAYENEYVHEQSTSFYLLSMGANETAGVWGSSFEITPPLNHLPPPNGDGLSDVACPPVGACVAIGDYWTMSGREGMAVNELIPVVEHVNPPVGPRSGGSTVTITGVDLGNAIAVKFGAVSASQFTVESPTSISATVPPGVGTVDVSVISPDGTSEVSEADEFTYVSAPTVSTGPPSAVTKTSASLAATVNPDGAEVEECKFEYGVSGSYGSTASCAVAPGTGTKPVEVSAVLSALTPHTTYHFRITASNASGTSYGSDLVLTTLGPPDFGRCVKLAPERVAGKLVYRGGFSSSVCILASAAHTGKYEWVPGVVRGGFGISLKEGTVTLQPKGGTKITCKGTSGSGEIIGTKEVNAVHLAFTSCESLTHPCTSAGSSEGTIMTRSLEGVLGWELESAGTVGLDLYSAGRSGVVMTYQCFGASPMNVNGSVIASVVTNRMLTATTLKFSAAKGIQKPTHLEGEADDVLLASFNGEASAQLGLVAALTMTTEEPIEIDRAF